MPDAFLALAETVDRDDSADEVALLNRLEADHANLRQAISFTNSKATLDSSNAFAWRPTWPISGGRGHFSEGRGILERAIATPGDIPPLTARRPSGGRRSWPKRRPGTRTSASRRGLALYQELGDLKGVAGALGGLGTIARLRGDLDTARSRHQDALETWRRAGDAAGAAGALDLGLTRQVGGLRGCRAGAARGAPLSASG